MSEFEPLVIFSDNELTVRFQSGTSDRQCNFRGVVDQTFLGDVVGIEILDLNAQLAVAVVLPGSVGGFPRWSYDDEIDALYVKVSDDQAQIQRSVVGMAYLEADSKLLSLVIKSIPGAP